MLAGDVAVRGHPVERYLFAVTVSDTDSSRERDGSRLLPKTDWAGGIGDDIVSRRTVRRGLVVAAVLASVALGAVAVAVFVFLRSADVVGNQTSTSKPPSDGVAASVAPGLSRPASTAEWIARAKALDAEMTATADALSQSDDPRQLEELAALAPRYQSTAAMLQANLPPDLPTALRSKVASAVLDLIEAASGIEEAAAAKLDRLPAQSILAAVAEAHARFTSTIRQIETALVAAPAAAPASAATDPDATAATDLEPANGSRASAEEFVRTTLDTPSAQIDWNVKNFPAEYVVQFRDTTGRECKPFIENVGGCGLATLDGNLRFVFVVDWTGTIWEFTASGE
jgi:hypothetical protein